MNFTSSAFLSHFHKPKQSHVTVSKNKKLPPFVHTIISPEDTKYKFLRYHLSAISNAFDFCEVIKVGLLHSLYMYLFPPQNFARQTKCRGPYLPN